MRTSSRLADVLFILVYADSLAHSGCPDHCCEGAQHCFVPEGGNVPDRRVLRWRRGRWLVGGGEGSDGGGDLVAGIVSLLDSRFGGDEGDVWKGWGGVKGSNGQRVLGMGFVKEYPQGVWMIRV